jgi:phosphoribosylaminoimidazolecarboxamide formyltransferase/IMP cyclohydrolase
LPAKRALLSVSHKAGLPAFARGLARLGFEIYSTGGTLAVLEDAAVPVQPVSNLTGFPEILDGRVKTLHPAVHAGLLARRDLPSHLEELARHGLHTIDLVCVNLYPFGDAAAQPGARFEDVIEQIDVGGPAMIRAAAKNHAAVVVVVKPERYIEVLEALGKGEVPEDTRRRLAAEAFAHTAAYDAQIAAWLESQSGEEPGLGAQLTVSGELVQALRYGENPHQAAAFYRIGRNLGGLAGARQLQGKELSFNNIQDAAAAQALTLEFERPAAAIVKHTNPCGVAVADDLATAFTRALEADPRSAYGGVVAVNRPLDAAAVKAMADVWLEVLVAPKVGEEAAGLLSGKKDLRVLEAAPAGPGGYDIRSLPGGFLAQTWDLSGFDRSSYQVLSRRQPSQEEWDQLAFAWLVVKHVKSNAIVLARDFVAVGVGAGQMSRVEAAELAVARAGERARGAVMASDALFPFADGLAAGLAAGITAVIAPGGAKREAEVVAAADAAGAAFVATAERHFRH